MKFKAVFRQSGGCDYTIGCGIRIVDLKATTGEEAIAEIGKEFGLGVDASEVDVDYDISEIDSVSFLEIAGEFEIDIDRLRGELKEADTRARAAADELAEKAELERLSRKYNKGK